MPPTNDPIANSLGNVDSNIDAGLNTNDTYRTLVEFNAAQLWTARPDGGLDYVNPRVAAYAGLPAEDLLGDGWGQIVHPLDLARAAELWRRCLSTGETYSVEMRLQRGSDRLYRWHLTVGEPVRDVSGKIVRWVGTNMDIDGQKRAVETADAAQVRARRERERLRRVFQYAPAAMMLYHGPNFVIELLNPVAAALIGKKPVLGKTVRDAFPEGEAVKILAILERIFATGEPYHLDEMRVDYDRDGTGVVMETYWNISLQPLNEPDEPVTDILSHAVEVTERVLARREHERFRESAGA